MTQEEKKMYCSKCGKEAVNPGEYCAYCGALLKRVPELENCPEIFEKIRLAWTEVPGYRRRRVFCVPSPLF